jgi:hypothetical protein
MHSLLGARIVTVVRLSVGFPLADVRPFVKGKTRRLKKPPWDLIERSDFLRAFGAGVDSGRQGGKLPPERRFLDADHSIRFPNSLSSIDFGGVDDQGRRGFVCRWSGRRLRPTATTQMLRMEIELDRPRSRRDEPLSPTSVLKLINDVLELPVVVGKRLRIGDNERYTTPDGRTLPVDTRLSQIGPHLASLYLQSTTSSKNGSAVCQPWWIAAGSTLVVFECQDDEVLDLPLHVQIDLDDYSGIEVGYLRAGQFGAHVLMIRRSPFHHDKDEINRVRDLIRHAHTESDTVAHVLRMLGNGNLRLKPQSQKSAQLLDYLDRAAVALESPDWFGFSTSDLLPVLYSALGWGVPSQRNQLLTVLNNRRFELGSRLERIRETWATKQSGSTYIGSVEHLEAHMERSGDIYNIPGQAILAPHGQVANVTMTQVWNNVAADLPLDQLAEELAKLRQALKDQPALGGNVGADRDVAIGQIAQAEQAALSNDGPSVMGFLKATGSWVLKAAQTIGVPIAVAALKAAIGIPG